MRNRIRSGPNAACTGGVISPTHSRIVERVRQGLMVKAGIHPLRLATIGINQLNEFARRSRTPSVVDGVRKPARILRDEQLAVCAWRRSSRNNELVSRKAGALVGLEHPIAEGVLFSQLEVGVQKAG